MIKTLWLKQTKFDIILINNLPLCSAKIFEVKGDAGLVCPVKGDPVDDWDASGDLGAE